MIHLNDTIKTLIDGVHWRTLYRTSCDKCGCDRGYLTKQGANKPLCSSCSHKNISNEARQKMSLAKRGKPAWNKGKTGVSADISQKISQAKKGKVAPNKGQKMSFEARLKLSCINQGIDVDEFAGFLTPENRRERNLFADSGLSQKTFERADWKCEACRVDKVVLHAHHKDSWSFYPDRRFEESNLVALCTTCHRSFHSIYGNGKTSPNTEQQFQEFLANLRHASVRKKIILVIGVAGSGKSWVCNQLKDKIYYVPYDDNRQQDIRSYLWSLPYDTILYDPFSHVSTFIRRNSDIFDIELYVIVEKQDVIAARLQQRGGQITPAIIKRMNRIKKLAQRASFYGTSDQVLGQLYARSVSPDVPTGAPSESSASIPTKA